jgi:hypothetical protein
VETIIRRPNKHISSRINNSNNILNRLRFSMHNRMILASVLALRFLALRQSAPPHI